MAAKKTSSRKSTRKYSKSASKRVESAMRRRKKGTLRQRQGRAGRQGEEPQAGHRHRPLGGAEEGREGPASQRQVLVEPQARGIQPQALQLAVQVLNLGPGPILHSGPELCPGPSPPNVGDVEKPGLGSDF